MSPLYIAVGSTRRSVSCEQMHFTRVTETELRRQRPVPNFHGTTARERMRRAYHFLPPARLNSERRVSAMSEMEGKAQRDGSQGPCNKTESSRQMKLSCLIFLSVAGGDPGELSR